MTPVQLRHFCGQYLHSLICEVSRSQTVHSSLLDYDLNITEVLCVCVDVHVLTSHVQIRTHPLTNYSPSHLHSHTDRRQIQEQKLQKEVKVKYFNDCLMGDLISDIKASQRQRMDVTCAYIF